ncbi:MAG: hypothetical protein ACXWPK_04710 [Isosphaeraceae bacterium]
MRDDAQFTFKPATASSRARSYECSDPSGQGLALREALPALYRSFFPA